MNAELIFVPSPRRADTVEGNSAILRAALSQFSVPVDHAGTPAADPSALKRALRDAVNRSDVIVVCGGIGGEPEDRTVATVCAAIGMPTRVEPGVLARLEAEAPDAGDLSAAALVPEDAALFSVAESPYPAAAVTAGSQILFLLPDEPLALTALLREALPATLGRQNRFFVREEPPVTVAPAPVFTPKPAPLYDDAEEEEADVPEEPAAEELISEEPISEDETAAEEAFSEEVSVSEEETVAEEAAPVFGEPAAPADPEAFFEPEPAPAQPESLPPLPLQPEETWDAEALAQLAEEPPAPAAPETRPEEPGETPKKKNPVLSALRFLLPWKGDGLVDVVRKLVFLAAFAGLVVSGTYVGEYLAAKVNNDSLLTGARDTYDPNDNAVNPDGTLHRFEALLSQNPNCVGWITVPNTKINNPVYQYTDNAYYLDHDATGKKNVYGAVFADCRATVTGAPSANITLYGHHMKDGTMFANLHKYKALSFYQENPVITFDTVEGGGGSYKVFACMITNAEAKDDDGYLFDFAVPSFAGDDAFLSWVEQVRRRSLYITPVDVVAGDEILTLSTCTYEIKDVELRCVVMARKVRPGETTRVNISEVSANPKVIYPAVWYARKGGAKPVYEDGLTTWLAQPDYQAPVTSSPAGTSSTQEPNPEGSSEATSSEAVSSETASPPTSSETTTSTETSSTETPSTETSSTETPSQAPETSSDTPAPEPTSSAETPSGDTPGPEAEPTQS